MAILIGTYYGYPIVFILAFCHLELGALWLHAFVINQAADDIDLEDLHTARISANLQVAAAYSDERLAIEGWELAIRNWENASLRQQLDKANHARTEAEKKASSTAKELKSQRSRAKEAEYHLSNTKIKLQEYIENEHLDKLLNQQRKDFEELRSKYRDLLKDTDQAQKENKKERSALKMTELNAEASKWHYGEWAKKLDKARAEGMVYQDLEEKTSSLEKEVAELNTKVESSDSNVRRLEGELEQARFKDILAADDMRSTIETLEEESRGHQWDYGMLLYNFMYLIHCTTALLEQIEAGQKGITENGEKMESQDEIIEEQKKAPEEQTNAFEEQEKALKEQKEELEKVQKALEEAEEALVEAGEGTEKACKAAKQKERSRLVESFGNAIKLPPVVKEQFIQEGHLPMDRSLRAYLQDESSRELAAWESELAAMEKKRQEATAEPRQQKVLQQPVKHIFPFAPGNGDFKYSAEYVGTPSFKSTAKSGGPKFEFKRTEEASAGIKTTTRKQMNNRLNASASATKTANASVNKLLIDFSGVGSFTQSDSKAPVGQTETPTVEEKAIEAAPASGASPSETTPSASGPQQAGSYVQSTSKQKRIARNQGLVEFGADHPHDVLSRQFIPNPATDKGEKYNKDLRIMQNGARQALEKQKQSNTKHTPDA